MSLLENINSPEQLKALDENKLPELCAEIREFLVGSVANAGGHLASNLGVVELTVALHRVYDTSSDRLVFDVGHQSYVHKMLTGRREDFKNLRKLDGLSGFPKPSESIHDAFVAGHASDSISVALGMARARTLKNEKYDVVALIGDGALTGGLAYEALNDAGESGEPLVVVLNDNGMSITKNVGGIAKYLAHQRSKPGYYSFKKRYRRAMGVIPGGKYIYRFTHGVKTALKNAVLNCSMFEDMGFQYFGPVDGHDVKKLTDYLTWAKNFGAPALVHVSTVKGKGYAYSEKAPNEYHGVGAFDPEKGVVCKTGGFSARFGSLLCSMAEQDSRICAITAAMQEGTGLAEFAERFPKRFFDVGIAEEHAVSMAAGMAKQGLTPVFAVYSTFLQRSYDMLIHDVALQNLHVVFAVDRAGLVGEDGETHHGLFDVGFLSQVPGMTVLCPASYSELETMLNTAVYDIRGPVAVRYPRGPEGPYKGNSGLGAKVLREGSDITLVSYGTVVNSALHAAEILAEKGVSAEIIKLGTAMPLEVRPLVTSTEKTGALAVLEEAAQIGSVGERLALSLALRGKAPKTFKLINLGAGIAPQGSMRELYKYCRIDAESVAETVMRILGKGETNG